MSGYSRNAVKSASKNQAPVVNMNDPLQRLVEKADEDMVPYYDPRGLVTGEPLNAREKLYKELGWDEKFTEINREVKRGASVKQAAEKALDTAAVSLPVFTVERLFISDGERSPVVDGLARQAVNTEDIELDEVTDVALASSYDEGGDITQADDTIANHSYTVENQGIVKQVTDKFLHTGRYNGQPTTVELGGEGVRRYLERQAHQGTNHDASGFPGLADWASSDGYEQDETGNTLSESIVQDLQTELEDLDTNRSDMMVTTDVRSFKHLKQSISDYQRFESPGDTIDFGFVALTVDDVPVFQTHGTDTSANSHECYVFDGSATFWAVLADITVKPLAETADSQRDVAIYSHMSLVTNAKQRVARAHSMDV